jgi:DNA modification methylase
MTDVTLHLGDCLEIMKDIPDNSVDAVIADPPYGETACEWDKIIDYSCLWRPIKRIRKDNSPIVLFSSEPFGSYLRFSNISEYKYDWVWQKNNTTGFAIATKQPMKNHELITVFYKKQCTYNPQKEPRLLNDDSKKRMNYKFSSTKGKNRLQGGIPKVEFVPEDAKLCYPKSVQFFKSVSNNKREHPTQKPIELLKYLVGTYSNKNDTILDFSMGSGTTGVACVQTGRNFIGIEIEPKYYEIAEKRIKEAQMQFRLGI